MVATYLIEEHCDSLPPGRPVCRSEVKLATLLKKDGSYVNGEGKALAISDNLSEDQERATTLGVLSKIIAYPNDAIGKACGPEHQGRFRVLGPSVCQADVFPNRRHFADFIPVGNFAQANIEEELATTKEELAKTKEEHAQTKEKLTQATNKLDGVHNFLQHKFGAELSMFNLGSSSS